MAHPKRRQSKTTARTAEHGTSITQYAVSAVITEASWQ